MQNRVLGSLSPESLEKLKRTASRVRVVHDQLLADAGQPMDHAYFMLSGLACLVTNDKVAPAPQVAMIGREGAVGLVEFFLESRLALASAFVQIGGIALRLSFESLNGLIEPDGEFRRAGLRSLQDLTRQVMDGSASNASDTVGERCVRWLVMARDRLDSDELMITHDALAALFGVQRSGVTAAISKLQRRGLIQTGRGRITLLDLPGLRVLGSGVLRSSANHNDTWAPYGEGGAAAHPSFPVDTSCAAPPG